MSATGRSPAVLAACIGLTTLASALPGRLPAQTLEAVPYGGAVLPLGKLAQQGRASISHPQSVAFGGRLRGWLSRSVGLEIAADYSPGGYRHVDTTGAALDTTGGLFHGTGRLLYRVVQGGPWSAHVLAGAGFVTHSGAYVSFASGKTGLCGVVGAAGQFRISAGWTVQLTAEDYIYAAKLGGFADVSGAAGKLNNDVVISLGVAVPLGARGGDDDYMRVIR